MSNGRLEPELWHVQLIDRIGVILTINLAMSVLIDKSVCPHASGQQTAMHVCDERGRGAGERTGWPHTCKVDRQFSEVDRQYDPNSDEELNMQ